MYSIVYVTTSSEDEAKKIGKALVEEKLVACANIIPKISSFYYWQNKFEEDSESILLLKTKNSLVEKVIKRTKELHSYDVPAILEVPIKSGNEDYLKWIEDNVKG